MSTVFTIGHSNHPIERFVGLLRLNGVTAVADARSAPHSRFNPQYGKEALAAELAREGILYVFLGRELGARPGDASCYEQGRVVYGRLAATAAFRSGIERVRQGAFAQRLALMCAEKEPLECHRTLLVGRALEASGTPVSHILADGRVEPNAETMQRLLRLRGLEGDLFGSQVELIAAACEAQERRIAYRDEGMEGGKASS